MFTKLKFGERKRLILVGFLILLSNGLYGLMTYFIGRMVDFGMAKNIEAMNRLAQTMILLAIITFVIDLLSAFVQGNWIKESMIRLKRVFIDSILNQEVIDLQKDKTSKMYSNLTNDFDRYETKYIKNIPQVIGMIGQFSFAMILLWTVSPIIMALPLIMLVYFWSQSKKSSAPIKKEEQKKSESLEDYTHYINETTTGYEVIKQHQLEESREETFYELARQVQLDNYQVDVQTTKVEAKNSFIINAILLLLVIGGMLFATELGISFGNIVIVFSAFSQVMWPIQRLSTVLAEMRGIEDVIAAVNESLKTTQNQRNVQVNRFENLSFNDSDLGYVDQKILDNVQLEVNKGEKILIIGPSGAGKSTILKTIRQSIEAYNGVVTLNGHDILTIQPHDYFSLFATVDQVGFIFSGSLKENISLYQDVSDGKIVSVMNQVGLGHLDLETMIQNDGGNLSGGQRARVLLARALCLDAQVIVCDEIFASLDAQVARSIESDLLALNMTSINVSHIYFEENLLKYDRIYIVENQTIREAESLFEVKERLLESVSDQ